MIKIFEYFLKSEIVNLNSNNIVLKCVGDKNPFNLKIKKLIENAEILTSNNTGMQLNIAINYGGTIRYITFSKKN